MQEFQTTEKVRKPKVYRPIILDIRTEGWIRNTFKVNGAGYYGEHYAFKDDVAKWFFENGIYPPTIDQEDNAQIYFKKESHRIAFIMRWK